MEELGRKGAAKVANYLRRCDVVERIPESPFYKAGAVLNPPSNLAE